MRGLFIGIGGTGDQILTRLKDRVYATLGEIPDTIQFRLLDTEGEAQRQKSGARLGDEDAELGIAGNEYLQLKDNPPGRFRELTGQLASRPDRKPELSGWYRADKFNTHLPAADFNLTRGAGQHRQIARMGSFLNKDSVMKMLGLALKECSQGQGESELPIWIVGSVAGGTGAGLFMDVALMAREASDKNRIQKRIIGAAVLPDVFEELGIDGARAYAALRELERFQAPVETGYLGRVDGTDGVRFSVRYDAQTVVHLNNMLFDNLVFYNRRCDNLEKRENHYSQIADGLNLLLDQAAGNEIYSRWINATEGQATSFNTRRIFVPFRLYERLFILDAARQVADGLLPVDADGVPDPGSDDERGKDATLILKEQLFPLYEVLAVETDNRESKLQALSSRMDASYIVERMLGFTNPARAFKSSPTEDEKRAAARLYADIFDDVQTARDSKDNFEDSRTHVVAEVARRSQDYQKGDGKDSFQASLGAIREMVTDAIKRKIDDSISAYLGRQYIGEKALGGALRMLIKLQELIAGLEKNLNDMPDPDGTTKLNQARGRETATHGALQKMSRRPLVWRGNLASAQEDYLSAARAVNQQLQRQRLVEFLRELIDIGKQHVQSWIAGINAWNKSIAKVRSEAKDERTAIEARLTRQTRVDSAFMGLHNTEDMDGYYDYLREKCLLDQTSGKPLVTFLLDALKWKAGEQPQDIALQGWPESGKDPVKARDFPDLLERYLREKIKARAREFEGMARYLKWLRDEKRDRPVQLAGQLVGVIRHFLDTQDTSQSRKPLLLYGDDWSSGDGTNEFTEIFNELKGTNNLGNIDPLIDSSGGNLFEDKNVLAVLLADNKIPYQNIPVFEILREQYVDEQNKAEHEQGWRAQAYHLFRCDQETWHIEHQRALKTNNRDCPEIPGHLARLLDDPKLSRLFGEALVSGVIREVQLDRGGMFWACGKADENNPGRLIWLNNPDAANEPPHSLSTPDADNEQQQNLLRAFVTFVMDKKDRRSASTKKLNPTDINNWIDNAMAKSGKTLKQMAQEYRTSHPERFEGNDAKGAPAIGPDTFLALVLNHYLADLLETGP